MQICSRHWLSFPPSIFPLETPRTSEAFLISEVFRAFRHHPVIKYPKTRLSPIYSRGAPICQLRRNSFSTEAQQS